MQKRRESEYSHPSLSNHDLRRVAVEAVVDPRAVVRYLRARPMNSNTRVRVERALVACGFAALLSATSSSTELAAAPKATNGAAVVVKGAPASAHPMLERRRG